MTSAPDIDLAEYQYDLPEDRIAKHPLADRDQSKLMVWKDGATSHKNFFQLPDLLPVNSHLFFNNTRVIPARFLFEKPSGGTIEVFLLNPADQGKLLHESLQCPSPVTWKCAIGNAKRWPSGQELAKSLTGFELRASWPDRSQPLVEFSWTPSDEPFGSIVEAAGHVPLPPYLNRPAVESDRERYQTVYSSAAGAVAAPTAGLHFTPAMMEELKRREIGIDFLTLHVSAGTFLPVKVANAAEHKMHEEELIITKSNIISLLQPNKRVIAVGTTALRTLESAYWYGVMLAEDPKAHFSIRQDLPYEGRPALPLSEALGMLLNKMEQTGEEELAGHTSLYVVPGYRFRVAQGLITNFHQPKSTLLLLISAFVGPAWKSLYNQALERDYRFLSYGDSSLLLPPNI